MIRKCAIVLLALGLAACARSVPAPAPLRVPIPPPPRRLEPQGFTGLAPTALRARFGAPAFTRKDGVTDMWRYDGKSCHAFFFLTAGAVSHVETIPRGPGDGADPACLSALRKAS